MVQVYETEAYKLGSFDSICNASEVYEIVKTKDFNRCIERPIFQSVNPSMHIGSFGSARVGEAVQVLFFSVAITTSRTFNYFFMVRLAALCHV